MSYTTVPFYSPEESLRLIMGKWKLTGQNYPVWKLHFDNVLRGQDKLYVINKALSRPKSNAPEEEFAEYFRFMADESDVMSILSFSASPEFTVDLRVKFYHEVVKGIENQIGSEYPDSFQNYPNTQHETSQLPSSDNDVIPENVQTTQKGSRVDSWDTREDMVLMSSWIFVSEDAARGKNQRKGKLWTRVQEQYDATRTENPEGLSVRNENQIKGRWQRLNQYANKWIGAYKEAYRQKTSGMSTTDVENMAHQIYEASGAKFTHLKSCVNIPSGSYSYIGRQPVHARSMKRVTKKVVEARKKSRTTEEGDSVDMNQESPGGGSTIQRPVGRDATKKKGKGKASQSSSISNDFSENIRALTITRNNELEIMRKKVAFDQENFQSMQDHKMLRVLMSKDNLSPAEEDLKARLMAKLYG
ncbi:hypothetical protein OSB04_031698 [Centaurea solstitialis]|uniref:Myb-like domain-containing protein n=1 Tax=Centaurea solstitialis TaxID=347529 RepID=A0AA38SA16_9ASTR|nr:hypothetical protein OSB04_031698 [Centaurea solstitialis]